MTSTRYAYVSVLYGHTSYALAALAMGYSLLKTKTPYDRVLMITDDIDPNFKTYLSQIYTRIINTAYVQVNDRLFQDATRFRNVFTKLEAMSLIEYQKILLLDLDMIVLQNIDHLFNLEAPAACLKHHDVPHSERIPSDLICRDEKLVGSINAGLMLLKPDLMELHSIKEDLTRDRDFFSKYRYPEQEYLSFRWCDQWTSLSFKYNFQFGLTKRVKRLGLKADDIYVIHYSSSYKPWNTLIKPTDDTKPLVTRDEKQFAQRHAKYYRLWFTTFNAARAYLERRGFKLNSPVI